MKRLGDGEHDVVVGDRQQQCFLRFAPAHLVESLALRAVAVTTGVVGQLAVAARVALPDVSSERRGAAARDGTNGARLLVAQPGESIRVVTEDLAQFQLRAPASLVAREALHASAPPASTLGSRDRLLPTRW